MMGEGDTALVAVPEGDHALYLRSLERVAALRPAVLYPTHGAPLADPAEALERYRVHREVRIRQVRAALAASAASPAELVRRVYGPALHPALAKAAAGSLAAVLVYLAERGELRRLEDGRYTLTPLA